VGALLDALSLSDFDEGKDNDSNDDDMDNDKGEECTEKRLLLLRPLFPILA